MPASPRSKTVKVQALVNISLPRTEKDINGQNVRNARIVPKGSLVDMSEAEAANYGRLVRIIDDEHAPLAKVGKVAPASIIGIKDVNKMGKPNLKGTGALDMADNTRVYQTEAETDWEAQPVNNPIDPSYNPEG
jgi:hypothetical protein